MQPQVNVSCSYFKCSNFVKANCTDPFASRQREHKSLGSGDMVLKKEQDDKYCSSWASMQLEISRQPEIQRGQVVTQKVSPILLLTVPT